MVLSKIREDITYHLEHESHEIFVDAIESDESCFGGIRKSKRGLSAANELAVCR